MKYRVVKYGNKRWAVADVTDPNNPQINWVFDEEQQARDWVSDQMRARMSL